MTKQNGAGETGTAAGDGVLSAWDAIRSRRDVRAWDSLVVASSTSSGVGALTTTTMSGCGKDRWYSSAL